MNPQRKILPMAPSSIIFLRSRLMAPSRSRFWTRNPRLCAATPAQTSRILTEEELAKQLIPLYWVRMPKILATTAGMHRWVWDLHYTTPLSTRYDYPIAAIPGDTPRQPQGPIALPGQYTVRLTVNGHALPQPLVVTMDPRVPATRDQLALEFQKQQLLASLMTQSTEAITEARSLREQIQKLTGKSPAAPAGDAANSPASKLSGPLADAVSAFEKKLTAILGAGGFGAPPSPSPTLARASGNVAALYGELDRADAAPTAAQLAAMDATEKDFSAVLKQWTDLKSTDLPALNRQLKSANVPELQLASATRSTSEDSNDLE